MTLSSNYFPSIQYLSKFLMEDIDIEIEKCETFQKQSYRNRCIILSPNGNLPLTVPVQKVSGKKILMNEIKIDYSTNWQAEHLKSIEAAYRSSPFFEFYIDSFLKFFKSRYDLLIDFNTEILKTLLYEIEISKNFTFTEEYFKENPDFRRGIHPKEKEQINDSNFKPINYTQVFSSKFDFQPNLSVLDLLFNEGPNAVNILRSSLR